MFDLKRHCGPFLPRWHSWRRRRRPHASKHYVHMSNGFRPSKETTTSFALLRPRGRSRSVRHHRRHRANLGRFVCFTDRPRPPSASRPRTHQTGGRDGEMGDVRARPFRRPPRRIDDGSPIENVSSGVTESLDPPAVLLPHFQFQRHAILELCELSCAKHILTSFLGESKVSLY